MRVRHSLSLAPFLLVCGVSLAPAQDVSARYYDLIRNNDLAALRSFVKTAGPNAADPRGTTPLMYAASAGSLESMRILVDSGADVNARNAFGAAALHWSASDTGKARLLVAHGADVNASSKLGRTPLWLAASYDGGSEIVRLLLEKGADANAADTFQATPLLAAARANDIDTLRLLLGKGADANSKDAAGSTPLQFAAGWGNVEAMRLLLAKGADVNAAGAPEFDPPVKNGPIALGSFTPLLLAAAYGGPPAVKLLLDSGAAVNARDVRGMTPLMLAIASDHADPGVVRLLLSKGADPNLKSKDGESALDWARKFNRPDILPLLGLKAERASAPAAAVPALSRTPLSPKEAVDKSVALLARTGDSFLQSGGCVACHAQNLTGLAVDAAHANVAVAQLKAVKLQWTGFEQPLLQRLDPPGAADMLEYSLLQMAAGQLPAGNVTDAMIFNLAAQQTRAGNWHISSIARPPIAGRRFQPHRPRHPLAPVVWFGGTQSRIRRAHPPRRRLARVGRPSHHGGPRHATAGAKVGQRQRRSKPFASTNRAPGRKRRLVANARARSRRLRHRPSPLHAARTGHARKRPSLRARRGVPAAHPIGRRFLARSKPSPALSALLPKRFPARPQSVDLVRGDSLGRHGPRLRNSANINYSSAAVAFQVRGDAGKSRLAARGVTPLLAHAIRKPAAADPNSAVSDAIGRMRAQHR